MGFNRQDAKSAKSEAFRDSPAALPPIRRSRFVYGISFLVMIVVGLPTRLVPELLPSFMVSHVGDALWAMAIFFGLGWRKQAAPTRRLILVALVITWGIEFSQFIQTDWLNQLRHVKLFALILGFTFLPSDLLMYTLGILVAALIERTLLLQAYRPGFASW